MWRADKAKLDVSVKHNPGKRTHEQCGAEGYAKVRGKTVAVPALAGSHTLRAEIVGDELTAWIDDRVMWRGDLPATASTFDGPAGFRTDNVQLELVRFAASPGGDASARCPQENAADE